VPGTKVTLHRRLRHVKSRYSRWLDVMAAVSVTLMMFAGSVKSASVFAWIPVDLTALALVLVGVSVVLTLLASRRLVIPPVGGLAILAALIPGFFIGAGNPYTPKAQLAILITVYTAMGAFLLLRTSDRRRIWLWSLAVLGLLIIPLLKTSSLGTRSVGGSGATISAGQMLGVSIVVLMVLVMSARVRGRSHVLLAVVAVAVLGYELIGTGARGPTIAAAAALLITVVFLHPELLRRAVGAVVLVVAGFFALGALGFAGAERMRLAASGSFGSSPRVVLWEKALNAIPEAPAGFGWGNFWSVLPPSARLDSGYVQHAHNLVLEAFVEGGWVAGIAITAFLVLTLQRQFRSAKKDSVEAALLAVAVFYVICTMVSGTMADDRAMFAVLAAAFAFPGRRVSPDEHQVYEADRQESATATPKHLLADSHGSMPPASPLTAKSLSDGQPESTPSGDHHDPPAASSGKRMGSYASARLRKLRFSRIQSRPR
jgi:O-antigen ligase